MTSQNTRHQEFLEDALGRRGQPSLEEIVRACRIDGAAWKLVAEEVEAASGWSIGIQTLINWFPQYNKPAAELAALAEAS